MKKIYIIGDVASGKTTFSKKLSRKINIPSYELDGITWSKTGKERNKRTDEEQIKVINEINEIGNWLIEGTFRKSSHYLFELSDKIIFLDTASWKKKYRILLRFIKQQLRIEKSHYKSDFHVLILMYKWNRDFENQRNDFEKILNNYEGKIIIVKNAEKFLKEVTVEI